MTPKAHHRSAKKANSPHNFEFDAIHFKIISHIETCQSLAEVAKHLGVTRSAISQRLDYMEDVCGIPLAHRRPLKLTEAGLIFLKHAKTVYADQTTLHLDISKLRSTEYTLKIIAGGSILIDEASPALAATMREFIHLQAIQIEGGADEIIEAVTTGKADIGLIDISPKKPGLIFEKYRTTRAVLLMHRTHPLSQYKELTLRDVASYRMVELPQNNLIMDRMSTADLMQHFHFLYYYKAPNLEVAAHYACTTEMGLCVTLEHIATRYARHYDAHIAYLDEPWVYINLYTLTREIALRSEAMNHFISELRLRFPQG